MPKLLLATSNLAKVREYRSLLSGVPYELVTLAEEGIGDIAGEEAETLEENAILKATTYAARGQLLALADDSGLEVDALAGEPGARSARYAGQVASDRELIDYLLAKLEGVPWDKRAARFRCFIALARPGGEVELCCGECHGLISFEPRGEGGFGYDPIFYLPELGKTMAELPPGVKNQVSHRARAAQGARLVLEKLRGEIQD
jgi:XTP/dITP diphosphohydrolase